MDKPRLAYIDRLKGLGILWVVIGHFTIYPLEISDDMIRTIASTFHVPLLFFLSGYVIHTPPYLLKALKKGVLFGLPCIVLSFLFGYLKGVGLSNVMFDGYKYGYWYLFVLILFYIALSTFRLVLKAKRPFLLEFIIFTIFFIFFTSMRYLLPIKLSGLLSLDLCSLYWPVFVVGFWVRKYNVLSSFYKFNILFTITLLGYIFFCLLAESYFLWLYRFAYILSPFPFVYLFRFREKSGSLIENELERFGRHSLDIYVYQYFILWTGMISLPSVGCYFVSTHNYILEFILALSYSVLVSYVSILIGQIVRKSTLLNNLIYGAFVSKY